MFVLELYTKQNRGNIYKMSGVTNIAREKCEEVEQRHQLVAALIAGADISTMQRLLEHDPRPQIKFVT